MCVNIEEINYVSLKKVNLTHFLALSTDGNGIMMDH